MAFNVNDPRIAGAFGGQDPRAAVPNQAGQPAVAPPFQGNNVFLTRGQASIPQGSVAQRLQAGQFGPSPNQTAPQGFQIPELVSAILNQPGAQQPQQPAPRQPPPQQAGGFDPSALSPQDIQALSQRLLLNDLFAEQRLGGSGR